MADRADAASPDVIFRAAPMGRRWSIPGGEEDESSVTLYVVAVADWRGNKTRRFQVMIPMRVLVGGDLEVGDVQVHEVDPS